MRYFEKLFFVLFILFICAAARADVDAVYLTPHFHYDPVFQEDQNDYTDVGFDRCRRFLDALRADPDYAVVFSEIDYLKPFFDTFPEEREFLLSMVAANRIETGGSYSEPNEMSIGGEGLIRNVLYGRAYHEGVLGDRHADVYMPFDVFGHTLQLTQVLSKTRYKGCVWRKGNPPAEKWVGVTVPGLPPDFMNLAPDGSQLHHRREHYKSVSGTKSADDLINQIAKKKQAQDALGVDADFGLLSSDDFAYPETWLTGKSGELKRNKPPIIISGPSAYFAAVKKQIDSDALDLPVVSRDFSLYHAGTALTRADLKIGNRIAENMLLDAEKFSTIAALLGARYPEAALDKAWRQLLFGQHHDGITGTLNDRAFFDLMASLREAVDLALEARTGAAKFIVSKINTGTKNKGPVPVVVFNPTDKTRTDAVAVELMIGMKSTVAGVKDANGNNTDWDAEPIRSTIRDARPIRIQFIAEEIPSVGYKTYFVSFEPAPKNKLANSFSNSGQQLNTIKNEFYSITADPSSGGSITNIVDLVSGRTVIIGNEEFPGNELIVLGEDKGPQYPAWELSTTGVKDVSSAHPAEVSTQQGNTQSRLIVNGELPGLGKYRQEIILTKGVKRIDFVTSIIGPAPPASASDRSLWMVRFPAKQNGTAPIVEDRFYAAARRRSLKPLEYRTDLEKMNTLSAPYAANNWVEEGVAVRLDVYESGGGVHDSTALQLCEIVHTAAPESVRAARTLEWALLQRGVTCTPSRADEDRNADLLNRNIRFVIDIDGDDPFAQQLVQNNDAFAKRLAERGAARLFVNAPTNDPDIPFVPTLVISAAGKDKMNRLIMDMGTLITENMRIALTGDEDGRGPMPRVFPDEYGIALLNRGTLLHSFDNNGAIVMGLFHQAPWASDRMGIPFAFPETKTHRYTYALYPHAGDWREADTWRAGAEYNAPMFAVVADQHPGDLPSEMSFFSINSGSVTLSAIKAAGNPYASMKTQAAPGPHNGVILRMYEAEGKADTVNIKFFRPVKAAHRANMLEEIVNKTPVPIKDGSSINYALGPNAIETIIVEFADAAPPAANAPALAADSEITSPLYTSYWDYNGGAAVMKNAPVSISIDFPPDKNLPDPELLKMGAVKKPKEKKFKKGDNELRLVVSNNAVDARLKGRVHITTPDGWAAVPEDIDVNLDFGQGKAYPVIVRAEKPVRQGYVHAELDTGAGKYFSGVRIGEEPDLDASADVVSFGLPGFLLKVRIRNNTGGVIHGAATPIGPVETWPAAAAGDMSLFELQTRSIAFSMNEDEEKTLEFPIINHLQLGLDAATWFMVKITFNGEMKYMPVYTGKMN